MTSLDQFAYWLGGGFFGSLTVYAVAIGACCIFTVGKKFF